MSYENFKQAELALAAYSDLNSSMVPSEYLIALQDDGNGLSSTQAQVFANRYQVVDQHSDATGLSATVFEDNSTGGLFWQSAARKTSMWAIC